MLSLAHNAKKRKTPPPNNPSATMKETPNLKMVLEVDLKFLKIQSLSMDPGTRSERSWFSMMILMKICLLPSCLLQRTMD